MKKAIPRTGLTIGAVVLIVFAALLWYTDLESFTSQVEKHKATIVSCQTIQVRSSWNLTAVVTLEDGSERSILERNVTPDVMLYPGHTVTVYTYHGQAALSMNGLNREMRETWFALILLFGAVMWLGQAAGVIRITNKPCSRGPFIPH